jgi:hypothetical protein
MVILKALPIEFKENIQIMMLNNHLKDKNKAYRKGILSGCIIK